MLHCSPNSEDKHAVSVLCWDNCCSDTTKVEQTLGETIFSYNARMFLTTFASTLRNHSVLKYVYEMFSKGDVDNGGVCEDDRCKACSHEVGMAECAKRLNILNQLKLTTVSSRLPINSEG